MRTQVDHRQSGAGPVGVRRLGMSAYAPTWQAMRRFTEHRRGGTPDEIWLLEHPPAFTLGQAARREHILSPGGIPVVRVDRGGQVTYHGPGQLVAYVLLDLRRRGLSVRHLVRALEQSVIDLLASQDVAAAVRPGAPGVYVDGRKVAALGLRVRRGCSYHGLALNVAMDLEPFQRIDPCGYPGLAVTQLSDLGIRWSVAETAERFLEHVSRVLEFTPRPLQQGID
ncbi:MAG: lipoyl(octanoyl) transferase LipB [Gammaproteobacteria bacterium]|nr:lipoyl(octanoyl) transferase LipB [Gammaproteobacteria bacterium]NIR84226.1 lipoyl(octanoyl) transferase LipB [Gammaproteobacteria bacterium]NIR89696.1 lipoyl(octanoyl) transferase LipB [Gammaproteobacteria bacterium]NIU05384.1 lipoyl(octanoyl) transferase LipB [Gammaproteobacteria bacterium]NIV52330.1 lipoyl(octanoyl) transferase LipB [Gammaproteobacteria bacterium]